MIVVKLDQLKESLATAELTSVMGPTKVFRQQFPNRPDEFIFAGKEMTAEKLTAGSMASRNGGPVELLITINPGGQHVTTPLGDQVLKSIGLINLNEPYPDGIRDTESDWHDDVIKEDD